MSLPASLRLASWLLSRLSSDEYRDAMLGDIQERFGRGHGRAWLWKEAFVAVTCEIRISMRSNGSVVMKQRLILSLVLAAVFSAGYWTARSTQSPREEMQSARTREQLVADTIVFLEEELQKADGEHDRNRSPRSWATRDALRNKLDMLRASN